MKPREIIEKYYEYHATDWDAWIDLFDDNLLWITSINGRNIRVEGKESMREGVEREKKGYSKINEIPLEIFIKGNIGVAIVKLENATVDGVPVNAKGACYFKIERGKIVHVETFFDSVALSPFYNQFDKEKHG